jgi:hypothetical protein
MSYFCMKMNPSTPDFDLKNQLTLMYSTVIYCICHTKYILYLYRLYRSFSNKGMIKYFNVRLVHEPVCNPVRVSFLRWDFGSSCTFNYLTLCTVVDYVYRRSSQLELYLEVHESSKSPPLYIKT